MPPRPIATDTAALMQSRVPYPLLATEPTHAPREEMGILPRAPAILHTPSKDYMQDNRPPHPRPTIQDQSTRVNSNLHPLIVITYDSDGDIKITHAPRLATGPTASHHVRHPAVEERNAFHQPAKGAPRDPRDKYTKGIMPKVHVADPMDVLKYIDIDLIGEWESYQNGKLLAIPFGNEAENLDNHKGIVERLLTAATEITQADNVGISTPIPSEKVSRDERLPNSFLIYNLSDENINTLMQRGVWSSSAITFRVVELNPPRPDFLFTLKGFTTRDDTSILNVVKTVWQGHEAQKLINGVIDSFSCPNIRDNIHAFLRSVYIKRLNFRTKGNVEAPRFNVYADSRFIPDDDIWFNLRKSLANLPYTTPMLGRGTAEISPSTCSICHGVDHPTGMCEFPEMEGWNGPTHKTKRMTPYQYGDRNRCGTRSARQMRF